MDSLKGECEDFFVFHLDIVFGVLLESDGFGGHIDTIHPKANEYGRSIGRNTYLAGFLLVDDDKPPLPNQIVLDFA